MSAHPGPSEQRLTGESLAELQSILARYKPDDNSWPCGLVHLRNAIKLTAAERAKAAP